MRLGIIGLPQAGKTTIFNALTRSDRPLAMSAGRIETTTAVVDVPDERLQQLADLFSSKKIVHAQISFADVAGMGSGEAGKDLSPQLLNALTGMDGLLLVLRAFENDSVAHPHETVDAARDFAYTQDELLLNDLVIVERRLGKLSEERGKGGRDMAAIEREQALYGRLQEALAANQPLRALGLSAEEIAQVGGAGLLTLKPLLVVLNLGEGQSAPALPEAGVPVLALQGKLEMELTQLPAEDAATFLAEYGLSESGAQRVIRAAYDLLDTQTFYTVGEPEAHAWMLRRGESALEAAGTIHSDIARGFIRAEIIAAADLLALGGMAAAREAGKLRLEGKEYVMQDGDIINVRFNV
ncbi:MAG: YchF family ATPase [Anaerolineales bacterium]|nr:YchF family ATPase [Anaerolineales bacterium]MCW5855479.1 YchF family ATPase [Anaerolineales bacterium]